MSGIRAKGVGPNAHGFVVDHAARIDIREGAQGSSMAPFGQCGIDRRQLAARRQPCGTIKGRLAIDQGAHGPKPNIPTAWISTGIVEWNASTSGTPQMKLALAQPLPGIGDMVWHLPHIHAIADWANAPVTLLAKPRSLADQILEGDAAIADVMWIDMNPEGRRGAHDGASGFWRLTRELRARNFDAMIMLHHGHTLAAAAMLAGIPDRRGYGWKGQKWFLTRGPYLPEDVARQHQHTRATRFLEQAGIPLADPEPHLPVSDAAIAALPALPQPFVAMGIGASEASRQFGAARLAELARALIAAGWPAVVLSGGPGDRGIAETIAGECGPKAIPALGWRMSQTAALLHRAAFYVGNNTGVMNMAAAVGTRTYALFGTTPPFFHARSILPILSPAGGPDDGMARMTVDAVLAAIAADRGGISP